MAKETHPEIVAAMEALGLSYSALFIPQSQSRNAGEPPCLNWIVTLGRPGHPSLSTDYMQGIGHLEGYRHGDRSYDYAQAVKQAAEGGKWAGVGAGRMHNIFRLARAIPAPDVADVLSCLLSDASVINCGCFEEWADDFGVDKDSRAAEATYRACLDTALKLRALLGAKNLETLRELFE